MFKKQWLVLPEDALHRRISGMRRNPTVPTSYTTVQHRSRLEIWKVLTCKPNKTFIPFIVFVRYFIPTIGKITSAAIYFTYLLTMVSDLGYVNYFPYLVDYCTKSKMVNKCTAS